MAYFKPPTTAELEDMAQLKRAELAASWQNISQHLKQHREHLKLSGWETYAINRVWEIAAQQAQNELMTMLHDFFASAGSNIGLEKHEYEQKRQKHK